MMRARPGNALTLLAPHLSGLGLSSFFGRRYSAPLLMNGTRALPPPRVALPTLRTQLPPGLQSRFAPVLQRQPNLALAAGMARQPELATSSLSRSLAGPDPTRDLANRIRLSIAQKTEQMPGLSQARECSPLVERHEAVRADYCATLSRLQRSSMRPSRRGRFCERWTMTGGQTRWCR